MRAHELFEYFENHTAYWFNAKTRELVEIDQRLSHVFDVMMHPEKYHTSKEEMMDGISDSVVRHFLKGVKVNQDNINDLSFRFDGSPEVIKYMEDGGWMRVVVTPKEEISLNSNKSWQLPVAARFLTDLYPDIDTVMLSLSHPNGNSEYFEELSGKRLALYLKNGIVPSKLIQESDAITYLHGSYNPLPIGTIMVGRGQDYENDWKNTDFYQILEKYRPADKLSHKDAVFMVGTDEDIDLTGGATDYILTLQPLGPVSKHDLNWGSEISMLISNGHAPDSEDVRQAAENYWNGVPHTDESVWEYLTSKAKVLKVEEY